MNYDGTISPEAMAALIADFRTRADACRREAASFENHSAGPELRRHWLHKANEIEDALTRLEKAIQAEHECITPEDQ